MSFFTPTEPFTHYGTFYRVPVYVNTETALIGGQNLIYDDLFCLAIVSHNWIVEFGAQFFAAALNKPYEPGFPVWIKGQLN
jgi:hypothetical protein